MPLKQILNGHRSQAVPEFVHSETTYANIVITVGLFTIIHNKNIDIKMLNINIY